MHGAPWTIMGLRQARKNLVVAENGSKALGTSCNAAFSLSVLLRSLKIVLLLLLVVFSPSCFSRLQTKCCSIQPLQHASELRGPSHSFCHTRRGRLKQAGSHPAS